MSSTAPPPPPQKEAAFFTAIRSWGITRGSNNVFGGVADGVGQRIGLARVPARIILVVLGILLTGIVLIAYAAAWALLPDREGNIIIQNFGRGITNVGALIGIGIFAVIGMLNLDGGWWTNGFNLGWDSPNISGFGRFDHVLSIFFTLVAIGITFAVIGTIIFLAVHFARRSSSQAPQSPPAPRDPSGSENPDTNQADESVFAGAEAEPAPEAPRPAGAPGRPQPWEPAVLPGDPALYTAAPTSASAAAARGNEAYATATTAPLHTPALPRVPRPRVPGPGSRFYLVTTAWILISGAIIIATDRLDRLAVSPPLAWFALFMVGFGLILAGVAIAGRKLGFLGFISVPLVIAGMLTAVNSGELRETYDNAVDAIDGGATDYWIDDTHYDADGNVLEVVPELDPALDDPTEVFAGDYQQIYLAPECFDWEAMQQEPWIDPDTGVQYEDGYAYSSQARLTYTSLPADATVDVIAEYTVLTIPEGTNVILRADSNAQSTVSWESRGLYCEFWGGGQDNLSVINPGEPTLTLNVRDDEYANTIEVVEVAPEPASNDEVDPSQSPEPTAGATAESSTPEEEVQP